MGLGSKMTKMISNQCKEIQFVPIKDIKFHPKNRNKHPKDQLKRLAKIIQYQGEEGGAIPTVALQKNDG